MPRMYVPFPAPALDDADPCGACDGQGVTGEQYDYETPNGSVAVDVFCPSCGGCGRATHTGCKPNAHGLEPGDVDAGPAGLPVDLAGVLAGDPAALDHLAEVFAYQDERDEDGHHGPGDYAYDYPTDEDDEDDDEGPEGACPSCHGREWYPTQGFTGDADTPGVILVLRMPCGCTDGRAVPLEN